MERRNQGKQDYQVSVKALVTDDQGRLLMLREASGFWDLPGGRMEHGETPDGALERECFEELRVAADILDKSPRFIWSSLDRLGMWRLVMCYGVKLSGFNFPKSDECEEHGFFDKAGLDGIKIAPQTKRIKEFL